MPGIKTLPDIDFIRAFQSIDRIIQRNQPLFMLVWVGSVVALLAAAVLGLSRLEGIPLLLLLSAVVVYVVGIQVPTAVVNVQLNNRLQELDLGAADAERVRAARRDFEPRWVRWNTIRTVLAGLTVLLLLLLLLWT